MIDDNPCPAVTAVFLDNSSSTKTLELNRGVYVIKRQFESSRDVLVVRIKAVCLYEELAKKFLDAISDDIYRIMLLTKSMWEDREAVHDSATLQSDLFEKIRKVFNKYIIDEAPKYSLIDASVVMSLEDSCRLEQPYRELYSTRWNICDD